MCADRKMLLYTDPHGPSVLVIETGKRQDDNTDVMYTRNLRRVETNPILNFPYLYCEMHIVTSYHLKLTPPYVLWFCWFFVIHTLLAVINTSTIWERLHAFHCIKKIFFPSDFYLLTYVRSHSGA